MYLIDTNVLSELPKAASRINANVKRWFSGIDNHLIFTSVIVIQEIQSGIYSLARKDTVRSRALQAWLDDQVLPTMQDNVLSYDKACALECAGLHVPNPKPYNDAMIAATAKAHNMILVTRNIKDFAGVGVKVLNPYNSSV